MIYAMSPRPDHRRGGVLKALLILLLIVAAAAVVVYLIYTRGSDMQKGLRDKGEEIRDKVSGPADPAAQPEAGLPGNGATVRPPPPPAKTRSKPAGGDTAKPVYSVSKPPPVEKSWHTVAKGETLYSIAETYYEDGRLWKLIADANGLKETAELKEGMLITIPGR